MTENKTSLKEKANYIPILLSVNLLILISRQNKNTPPIMLVY